MAQLTPQDDYMKTALRLPRDLHALIQTAAAESGRSMNAEIVARLQESFMQDKLAQNGLVTVKHPVFSEENSTVAVRAIVDRVLDTIFTEEQKKLFASYNELHNKPGSAKKAEE